MGSIGSTTNNSKTNSKNTTISLQRDQHGYFEITPELNSLFKDTEHPSTLPEYRESAIAFTRNDVLEKIAGRNSKFDTLEHLSSEDNKVHVYIGSGDAYFNDDKAKGDKVYVVVAATVKPSVTQVGRAYRFNSESEARTKAQELVNKRKRR